MKIGIISDTHGYISSELEKYFQEVDLIIHAGDIGSMTVINSLEKFAKLECVRGNMDHDFIWKDTPYEKLINIRELRILVVHILPADYKRRAKEMDIDVVIFGHTHTAEVLKEDGLLLANPGSAGEKSSNRSIIIMDIGEDKAIDTKIINLG